MICGDNADLSKAVPICRVTEVVTKQLLVLKTANVNNVMFHWCRCDTTYGKHKWPAFGKRFGLYKNLGYFSKVYLKKPACVNISKNKQFVEKVTLKILLQKMIYKKISLNTTHYQKIADQLLKCSLNTGAECKVVSYDPVNGLTYEINPYRTTTLCAYNDFRATVLIEVTIQCEIDEKKVNVL